MSEESRPQGTAHRTLAKASTASVRLSPAEADDFGRRVDGAASVDLLNPEWALSAAVLKASSRAVKDLPVVPDDMSDPRLAVVLGIALRLARHGAAPDGATIWSEARRTGAVVGEHQARALRDLLLDLVTTDVIPAQLSWYALGVLDAAVRRRAQQAVGNVAAVVDKSIGTTVETLERELDAVRQLARRRHEAAQRPARLVVTS